MIQRIQSLWLLLAAVCAFLTMQFAFFSGNIMDNEVLTLKKLTTLGTANLPDNGSTQYNMVSLVLAVVIAVIAVIALFMYSTRKLQLRLTIIALLLSILEVVYMFINMQDFTDGAISLTSVFLFATPVFLFLATRGIYKDDKLVKSMDRLR
jgi:heme/copper-type cytochrome/quinol oxidase subunit 4